MSRTGPTEQHWRAVRIALEKTLGIPPWPYGGIGPRDLPLSDVVWDQGLRPGSNGHTEFRADGTIVVSLRSDRDPASVHRTMLHEIRHVLDHRLVENLPTAALEQRACEFARQMARL